MYPGEHEAVGVVAPRSMVIFSWFFLEKLSDHFAKAVIRRKKKASGFVAKVKQFVFGPEYEEQQIKVENDAEDEQAVSPPDPELSPKLMHDGKFFDLLGAYQNMTGLIGYFELLGEFHCNSVEQCFLHYVYYKSVKIEFELK